MSQHWVPEDDAATGGRPRIDDDTEGHRQMGAEPGMREQDEDDTEGHARAFGNEPGMRSQEDQDDSEGPGVVRY